MVFTKDDQLQKMLVVVEDFHHSISEKALSQNLLKKKQDAEKAVSTIKSLLSKDVDVSIIDADCTPDIPKAWNDVGGGTFGEG